MWETGCRDTLTLALVRALKMHGTADDKKTRDAVRVEGFSKYIVLIDLFCHMLKLFGFLQCFSPINPHIFRQGYPGICKRDHENHAGTTFALQAEFSSQVTRIREQAALREEEMIGGWYTEEKMMADLGYSRQLDLNHIATEFLL